MKRFGYAVILVLAMTLPGISRAMGGFSSMPSEKPVINRVIGEVTVKAAGSGPWKEGKKGMLLDSGDTVKTGPDGKCEIYHAGGAIRMYSNTILVVPVLESREETVSVKRVLMEKGAGIFRSSRRGIEDGFEVQTLHVIAGVKGTIFSVLNDDKGTTVSVYTGRVLVTDPQRTPETETMVGPGERMTVKDGVGFGVVIPFEPWNTWGDWKRDRELPMENPRARPEGDGEEDMDSGSPVGRGN